jgi:translation initiation factor IF-3
VVGENVKVDIYEIRAALKMAEEQGLDLVEISPKADPPVCKIIDYSKFKYEQKKKQKEIKAKAQKTVVKEIRFGPNTDDHDFDFKMKHAMNFLKEGAKVKAYVHFVGRSIVFKDRGLELLRRFADELEDYSKVEEAPKMIGKRMYITLAPAIKKK